MSILIKRDFSTAPVYADVTTTWDRSGGVKKMTSFAVRFACVVVSPLFNAISHVVFLVAKKQVVGVSTNGVIAFMQHPLAFWDGSVVEFPRQTMGQNQPFSTTTTLEYAVTVGTSGANRGPRPTPTLTFVSDNA